MEFRREGGYHDSFSFVYLIMLFSPHPHGTIIIKIYIKIVVKDKVKMTQHNTVLVYCIACDLYFSFLFFSLKKKKKKQEEAYTNLIS